MLLVMRVCYCPKPVANILLDRTLVVGNMDGSIKGFFS